MVLAFLSQSCVGAILLSSYRDLEVSEWDQVCLKEDLSPFWLNSIY